MTYEETAGLLLRHGWILECFVPLKIYKQADPASLAAGEAAKLVIKVLVDLSRQDAVKSTASCSVAAYLRNVGKDPE